MRSPAHLAMFFNQDQDTVSVQAHMAGLQAVRLRSTRVSDRGGQPVPVLAVLEATAEASHSPTALVPLITLVGKH